MFKSSEKPAPIIGTYNPIDPPDAPIKTSTKMKSTIRPKVVFSTIFFSMSLMQNSIEVIQYCVYKMGQQLRLLEWYTMPIP